MKWHEDAVIGREIHLIVFKREICKCLDVKIECFLQRDFFA